MKVLVIATDQVDGVEESYIEVDDFTPRLVLLKWTDGELDIDQYDEYGKIIETPNAITWIGGGNTIVFIKSQYDMTRIANLLDVLGGLRCINDQSDNKYELTEWHEKFLNECDTHPR